MTRISKYILAIGMIICIAFVGCAAAAVPHACAQCDPETTYPGSEICPQACVIAFDADTEWAYPVEEVEEVEETEEEDTSYLTSTLSGETLAIPTIDPAVSKLSGTTLDIPEIDPFTSKLSGQTIDAE